MVIRERTNSLVESFLSPARYRVDNLDCLSAVLGIVCCCPTGPMQDIAPLWDVYRVCGAFWHTGIRSDGSVRSWASKDTAHSLGRYCLA